jgi:hypothetical protein
MKTANNMYDVNTLYHGITLDTWAQRCHKELSQASGWFYQPLAHGQFGYDNMIVSIGYCLDHMTIDETEMADLIHQGWCKNFQYWRDNQPWLNSTKFKKPKKTLNDQRRDECLKLAYSELPADEQDKDQIIARSIIKIINSLSLA